MSCGGHDIQIADEDSHKNIFAWWRPCRTEKKE